MNQSSVNLKIDRTLILINIKGRGFKYNNKSVIFLGGGSLIWRRITKKLIERKNNNNNAIKSKKKKIKLLKSKKYGKYFNPL